MVAGAIALPVYSGTGEDVFIRGHLDGPVVRRRPEGSWSATWYCQDRAHDATGDAAVLRIDCAGKRHAFPLESAPVPAAVAPMPERLVVLSDLEGNSRFLESALRRLGISDRSGDWRYGTGHLVVLGDSVDRGREVFSALWRLHGLARQAHAAGGAVHLVLGNHEQYILRANISRAHPEHRYALQQMGGYAQAFGPDTVIGAWLRAQPVALKLGSVLFVHGGVSPEVAASGLSIRELNDAMRAYWRAEGPVRKSRALDAVLGSSGLTQYRGYFRGVEDAYPAAAQARVDRLLAQLGARQIVVAHTLVERVKHLHGGRVIAVDVNHDEALPEVLRYRNGVATVIDIGLPRMAGAQPETRLREFSLLDERDRQLIASMYRGYRSLAGIPQPY